MSSINVPYIRRSMKQTKERIVYERRVTLTMEYLRRKLEGYGLDEQDRATLAHALVRDELVGQSVENWWLINKNAWED